MCGIVGYLGSRAPLSVILGGLKKLEYRGYDSAGVAILDGGHFKRVRASGKLAELEKKLVGETFDGHLGIGHTRWATHGPPVEKNAHPHTVDGVSIVHNGIIENYLEIREELLNSGSTIHSDTDSELVAHLLAAAVRTEKDLFQAALKVMPKLHGAFSIVAVWEGQQDRIVAFKNGPPLVVGQGENEVIVASDIQAIVPYTKKILYVEDNELVFAVRDKIQVVDRAGRPLERALVTVDWSSAAAEKLGFPHFMLKEIFEQPRTVAAAMDPHLRFEPSRVELDLVFGADKKPAAAVLKNIDRIFIVACGTSNLAGMVGEYLIEKFGQLPVEIEFASEFRYREPVIPPRSLVLVISQSGETADTLAALRLARSMGVLTLSLCNVPHSSIDREADGKLYMKSDVEVGVASTKALTSTITVLYLLGVFLGKVRGVLSAEAEAEAVTKILAAPAQMELVLGYSKFFKDAALTLSKAKGFLYLGRSVSFPVALEGALKLKELAYMHAEGYAAGEMKHGPIALIDEKMVVVVIVPKDAVYEKTVSNLEEVRARGGQIIAIGTGEDEKLKKISNHYLGLPEASWGVSPLLSVIPVQLMAYHVANALGHDVDQPRNLAKSVTVE